MARHRRGGDRAVPGGGCGGAGGVEEDHLVGFKVKDALDQPSCREYKACLSAYRFGAGPSCELKKPKYLMVQERKECRRRSAWRPGRELPLLHGQVQRRGATAGHR